MSIFQIPAKNALPKGKRIYSRKPGFTETLLRPLARRRESTFLPPWVFMRVRKPCVFDRLRRLGWNVRLGMKDSCSSVESTSYGQTMSINEEVPCGQRGFTSSSGVLPPIATVADLHCALPSMHLLRRTKFLSGLPQISLKRAPCSCTTPGAVTSSLLDSHPASRSE